MTFYNNKLIATKRREAFNLPPKLCRINEDSIQERAVNQHLYNKVFNCATINALNAPAALWKSSTNKHTIKNRDQCRALLNYVIIQHTHTHTLTLSPTIALHSLNQTHLEQPLAMRAETPSNQHVFFLYLPAEAFISRDNAVMFNWIKLF